ncbi:MAG: type IV secretion system DNA-binding domain-containing protein [Verrucomicrobiales bacterium]
MLYLLRLSTAFLFGAAGVMLFLEQPTPLGKAGSATALFVGIALVASPQRKAVMRFGHLSWTREELCRHVLITGDTGCGKTSSGFHSILVGLTKSLSGWGGLVIGVKGDETEFLGELLDANGRSDDLVHLQVRPVDASPDWKPPHRFNLLSDRSLPWTAHAKAIVDTASSMTEGRQDAFFKPMAQIALANALQLLDQLGRPVTLVRAYHLLTSERVLKEAVEQLEQNEPTEALIRLSDFFHSTFIEAKAPEQREGIEGTIKTYLGFFLDPDLAAVFCSDEQNTFEIGDVDRGAIIATSMPQRFVSERRYINTYLKMLFFYHALRRYERPRQEQVNCNQLLLVVDEYQAVVTASEDGISDHTIIDRIRGAKCAIIAGMQSEVSADPAIGRDKRKVLALNFRTRLIFRAADMEGATASADFIGKKTVWKRSRSSKAWGSVSHTRREDEDYKVKVAKLMELRDHVALVVHPSKRFTKKRIVPVDGFGRVPKWFRNWGS